MNITFATFYYYHSMRKLFLTGTMALTIFMFACKTGGRKITGKWVVAECTITNLEELRKSQLNGIPDSLASQYKERLEGQIKAFTDDAQKEVYNFDKDSFDILRRGKSDRGVWKISSDNKMLFLIPNESPAAEAINIDKISAKEITISKKLTAESNAVYVLKKGE